MLETANAAEVLLERVIGRSRKTRLGRMLEDHRILTEVILTDTDLWLLARYNREANPKRVDLWNRLSYPQAFLVDGKLVARGRVTRIPHLPEEERHLVRGMALLFHGFLRLGYFVLEGASGKGLLGLSGEHGKGEA